jgi:uncharacterized protein (TIGR03435 family)
MAILDSRIRTTTPQARPVPISLGVVAFGVLALGWTLVQAPFDSLLLAQGTQTPATENVRFEVASVKRNLQGEAERAALPAFVPVFPGRSQTLPGGRLRGPNMSVREIIRDAYGYRNRPNGEIVGAPDWIDKERYDIEARAAHEFPASTTMGIPPDAQAALRALLAERFNLKARIEVQRRPIYELVMARADRRLGENLKPSKGGCRSAFQREPVNTALINIKPADGEPQPLPPCLLGIGPTAISTTNMPMTDLVRIIGMRPEVNTTVIDRTGLTGNFDFTIGGSPEPMGPIKPLLESQLGLTLRAAEGPVEILVIEQIDHPTEN